MIPSLRRLPLVLALATMGTAFLHAYVSCQVTTLLHPLLHPLVAGTGVLLLLAAALFLLLPDTERPRWKSGRDLTLAFVLLFALAAAPGSFSSLALANRTVADPSALLKGKGAAEEDAATYAWKPDGAGVIPLEVTDLFMAIGLPKSMAALDGKKVRVIGQYDPSAQAQAEGSNRFHLVRFLMFCCAADAQPVALAVEGTPPADLPGMGWAQAVGTVHFEAMAKAKAKTGTGTQSPAADQQEPVLTLESVKAIPEPKDKFLY